MVYAWYFFVAALAVLKVMGIAALSWGALVGLALIPTGIVLIMLFVTFAMSFVAATRGK